MTDAIDVVRTDEPTMQCEILECDREAVVVVSIAGIFPGGEWDTAVALRCPDHTHRGDRIVRRLDE